MDSADFDYVLPQQAVAQVPLEPRDSARLLVDGGPAGATSHLHVRDLPSLLGPGDLVVLNDTSVMPARLHLTKTTGGLVEVLLLEPLGPLPSVTWECLVKPSRRVPTGTVLQGASLRAVVGDDRGEGRRSITVEPALGLDLDEALALSGEVPLPPYIHTELTDPARYRTVYEEADERWSALPAGVDPLRSVAAPTAGLHLTPDLCARIEESGARIEMVRLAVGLGTFRPITAERIEDHTMHRERFTVPDEVLQACREAQRVIAVGTTVVRALESAAAGVGEDGRTDLFINGDYPFALVDAMVTNFHVPRSSLLVLVDAFVGSRWRRLYEEALGSGYRFLSFGDAMFLRRGRSA